MHQLSTTLRRKLSRLLKKLLKLLLTPTLLALRGLTLLEATLIRLTLQVEVEQILRTNPSSNKHLSQKMLKMSLDQNTMQLLSQDNILLLTILTPTVLLVRRKS